MTTRFSDIIREKSKQNGEKKPSETIKTEEGFRLSNSRILKAYNPETSHFGRTDTEAQSYYMAFIDKAQETGHSVKDDRQIRPSQVLFDLNEVINRDMIDSIYAYAMSAKNDLEYIVTHTVDVTFTSLKIGKGMNYDLKMMLRLGLAAFLENVGMYKIPEDKLSIKGKLLTGEITLIRQHPETSYDLLANLGERYAWLAEAALGIHERSDGSGYPSGLKEEEILELSSIIGLSDTYCALIRNRPYRDKLINTEAIRFIIDEGRKKFPSRIIRNFLDQISIFPVNTYVKLSNGSIGRVLSTNRRHPLSPVIEILYDSEGNKLKNRPEIALAKDPLLYIDKSIDPDELVPETDALEL